MSSRFLRYPNDACGWVNGSNSGRVVKNRIDVVPHRNKTAGHPCGPSADIAKKKCVRGILRMGCAMDKREHMSALRNSLPLFRRRLGPNVHTFLTNVVNELTKSCNHTAVNKRTISLLTLLSVAGFVLRNVRKPFSKGKWCEERQLLVVFTIRFRRKCHSGKIGI